MFIIIIDKHQETKFILRIYFTIVYGQRITQFIFVTLLCWTAHNAVFIVF